MTDTELSDIASAATTGLMANGSATASSDDPHTSPDGTLVPVKVQRPDLARLVSRDLDARIAPTDKVERSLVQCYMEACSRKLNRRFH